MAYEEKSDEILSHAECIEKMQLLDYLSGPKGIYYGFAMAAAEALLLTFSDLDSEASNAWNRFQQRLALIHAIPKEEFEKKFVYCNLRVDPGKGKVLQKETLYVHMTAEGNLAYRILDPRGEEVSSLIHVGMENGKCIYRPLNPPGHFPRGVLAPGFNLEVLEEHQHLNAILKITTERGHTQKQLPISSLSSEVLALLIAHPLMQSIPPENWGADTVSIPVETWNTIRSEIYAFFDKVNLLFQAQNYAKKYPDLFPQEATPKTQGLGAASLVRSAITEEQEGQLTITDSFTGIYTPYALTVCFTRLAQEAEKTQESVVLTLGNLGQEITVAYDCKEKRWVLSESQKLSGRYIKGDKEIAEEVFSRFFSHEINVMRLGRTEFPAVLRISVMTLGEKELPAAAKAWKKNLHRSGPLTVSREKTALVDIRGVSWLRLAASYGEIATVRTLLRKGADPNQAAQKSGITSLFHAAQNGHTAVVQALLEGRAHPNQARHDGATPLCAAAENGHTAIVQALLKRRAAPNKAWTNGGATPLYLAAEEGHTAVVQTLLEGNADPNKARHDGTPPLYIAAQNGHTAVVHALLEGHADPNQAENEGIPPLCIAAENGHTEAVQALLQGRADPNKAWTNGGATALYIASRNGHAVLVQALLRGNADPNQADNNSATPLLTAAQKGHTAVVQALLEGNADPNQAHNNSLTPLLTAAQKGHTAVVQALLEGNAHPNKAWTDGITPLYFAAQNGHVAVVQALLEDKAEPNQAGNDDVTPLYIAAQNGHVAVARALLAAGANMHMPRGQDGMTPLQIAEKKGNKKMLELFRTCVCMEELNSYIREKEEIYNASRFTLLGAAIPRETCAAAKACLLFLMGQKGHLEPATIATLQADERLGKIYQSICALFPVLQAAEIVEAQGSANALGWGGMG